MSMMEAYEIDANYSYFELWHAYKDVGQSPLLILTALLLQIVILPGILMNSGIIYITIKYRQTLCGTTSFLLCLNAFYEVLHQSGHPFFAIVAISGLNFVPYSTAFKVLVVPLLGCSASLVTIVLTSLDRLFQLALPNWHLRMSEHRRPLYLSSFVLFSLFCGLLMALKFAHIALLRPNAPQTGTVSDIFLADFKPIFFLYMAIFNSIAILLYAIIWRMVKRETAALSMVKSQLNHRLSNSILAIVGISICSYLLNALLRLLLLPLFQLGQIPFWFLEFYVGGLLLNLGVTLNAPVLYLCSEEYRKCFVREFSLITKQFGIGVQSQQNDGLWKVVEGPKEINKAQQKLTNKNRVAPQGGL